MHARARADGNAWPFAFFLFFLFREPPRLPAASGASSLCSFSKLPSSIPHCRRFYIFRDLFPPCFSSIFFPFSSFFSFTFFLSFSLSLSLPPFLPPSLPPSLPRHRCTEPACSLPPVNGHIKVTVLVGAQRKRREHASRLRGRDLQTIAQDYGIIVTVYFFNGKREGRYAISLHRRHTVNYWRYHPPSEHIRFHIAVCSFFVFFFPFV